MADIIIEGLTAVIGIIPVILVVAIVFLFLGKAVK